MINDYKFTSEQLAWYVQYEEVKQLGLYNMVLQANLAMQTAGLTKDQYIFVLQHYTELKQQYDLMQL